MSILPEDVVQALRVRCSDVRVEDREVAPDCGLAHERHEREVTPIAERGGVMMLRDAVTQV